MKRDFLLLKAMVLFGTAALIIPPVVAAEPGAAEAKLAKEAPATLLKATRFTVGAAGEAAETSNEELALRALLKRPDAAAECRKLVEKATSAGQLYGLLGLKQVDEPGFKKELARFKESKVEVETQDACIVWRRTTGELAKWIENGSLKLK